MTTIFRPAFMGSPSFSVKPITLAVMHDDIPPGEISTALKNAVPQGFVGTSPYVVKTLDGEYLVYADGNAQFIPLGRAPGEQFSLNGSGNIPIVNSEVVLGRLDPIRVHLSQEDVAPLNRLLDVRVSVLRSRGAAIIPSEDADYFARLPIPPDDWTEAEIASLSSAAASPSGEELQDVALIDQAYEFVPLTTRPPARVMRAPPPRILYGLLYASVCGRVQRGMRVLYEGPGIGDPFYCTGASREGHFRFTGWPSAAEYFGLKPNEAWGEQRLATHNAKVLADALLTYPFPGPIPLAPGFWYYGNRQALADLANSGLILDETLARFFITLLTLTSYEAVAARIISWAEEKAEKAQKWAIIRIVAAAAIGAILSFALAPALASLIPAGVPISGTTVASAITAFARDQFSEMELERISKGMEDAAKIFAVNDPAFAEEVRIANMTLEWFAGEFETSADTLSQMDEQAQDPPPTPEEFGVNTEYPEASSLQKAILGAGAGVGVVGLLLFLLR